jgi:hypothetical protein
LFAGGIIKLLSTGGRPQSNVKLSQRGVITQFKDIRKRNEE